MYPQSRTDAISSQVSVSIMNEMCQSDKALQEPAGKR